MHSTNFFLGGDMKIIEQWVSFILNGQGISYIIISSKWLFLALQHYTSPETYATCSNC